MAVNVGVEKNAQENNMSLLRRFRRRVQSSGVLPHLRSTRYSRRRKSKLLRKRATLKSIERKKELLRLYKLGKIDSLSPKRKRRR